MSLYETTMEIARDGSVRFPGIDHSNASPLLLVARFRIDRGATEDAKAPGRRDYVVVRHPGGKCWSGRFSGRSTVPVHFMVFRLVERVGKGRWRVEDVVEVRPREHVEALVGPRIQDLLQ